jgi:hypothetical protein
VREHLQRSYRSPVPVVVMSARAVPLRRHGRERGQHHGAEVPADPDQVQGGCRVHAAMVAGWQVTPHHRNPVTAGLARPVATAMFTCEPFREYVHLARFGDR